MTDKLPLFPGPSSPAAPARPSRGRPKDLDKRAAILKAAKIRFLKKGLIGTSMEAIAADAGVSKLTLYSHFRNKDELFRQTVTTKCREHTPDALFDIHDGAPLRERLLRIGQGFVDLINSADATNLYRMMAAQGGRVNKLGRLFWEAGPERTMHEFSRLLAAAAAAGELEIGEPRRAAAHFFILLKGEAHLKHLVGAGAPPTPTARQRHVRDVVEVFLRAYSPKPR
ncbi:MAG: TetR/AcrR family transcriptional regulator [Gammaproteobacteria bacterium]